MSTLHVKVCKIDKVFPHPNADRLDCCKIMGWQSISAKGRFKEGDLAIFFPPDAVLPPELANGPEDEVPGRLNVRKYLASIKNSTGLRVRATRLRGIESYGILEGLNTELGDSPDWKAGDDVADHFGVTKWEPPEVFSTGDMLSDHPRFYRYTNIENYGNYPDLIHDGEMVCITEKLHGTNCVLGKVLVEEEGEESSWEYMAGSHSRRRKEFDASGKRSLYWFPMTENVKELLDYMVEKLTWTEPKNSVQIYGEIFGSGVQDMAYGCQNGQKDFRAFDISINNRYLDYDVKASLLNKFNINMVPILYKGPFDRDVLQELTSGPTTVCDADVAGKFSGREGVVITPLEERYEYEFNKRCILKSISVDYLARKGGTDSH